MYYTKTRKHIYLVLTKGLMNHMYALDRSSVSLWWTMLITSSTHSMITLSHLHGTSLSFLPIGYAFVMLPYLALHGRSRLSRFPTSALRWQMFRGSTTTYLTSLDQFTYTISEFLIFIGIAGALGTLDSPVTFTAILWKVSSKQRNLTLGISPPSDSTLGTICWRHGSEHIRICWRRRVKGCRGR
jgi:hypothetical protein